jgi:hypothetical protein
MPVDVEGWIEVKRNDSSTWVGKIPLNDFFIPGDSNSDYIFGITKHPTLDAVAANRGLPDDISSQVENTLDSYREFEKEEKNFSFDELFGFSYMTYSEMLASNISVNIDSSSDWVRVIESMSQLQKEGYKEENIRVIVWANW